MHQVICFKNQLRICMISKNIDTVDKIGNQKHMWWRKPTPLLFHKKRNYTVNKTDKSQTSKITVPTSIKDKPDTLNSIDKSRSTQRTNLSNKSTRIGKLT